MRPVCKSRTDPDLSGLRGSPICSKSVAFDLTQKSASDDRDGDHNADTGYETDDSDSTIDGTDESRRRHDHHRRSSVLHAPTPEPPSTSSHRKAPAGDPSDSESTIELPDRFDAEGHRLPDGDEDGIVEQVEQLLRSVFSDGRSRGRRVW